MNKGSKNGSNQEILPENSVSTIGSSLVDAVMVDGEDDDNWSAAEDIVNSYVESSFSLSPLKKSHLEEISGGIEDNLTGQKPPVNSPPPPPAPGDSIDFSQEPDSRQHLLEHSIHDKVAEGKKASNRTSKFGVFFKLSRSSSSSSDTDENLSRRSRSKSPLALRTVANSFRGESSERPKSDISLLNSRSDSTSSFRSLSRTASHGASGSFSSLKRSSVRADSYDQRSSTAGGMRLGARLRDILRLSSNSEDSNAAGTASWRNSWSSLATITNSKGSRDSLAAELGESGDLYISKNIHLKVYFNQSFGCPIGVSVSEDCSIFDAITDILSDPESPVLSEDSTQSSTREKLNSNRWRMYKIDRNQLAIRSFMEPHFLLQSYNIKDGDEVRLLFDGDVKILSIEVRGLESNHCHKSFQYDLDTSLKSLIHLMVDELGLEDEGNYGMYYKKLGIWLDPEHKIATYEIDPQESIEFRKIRDSAILRIRIEETNSQFALKIIPDLTILDLKSMIAHSINVRGIQLSQFPGDDLDSLVLSAAFGIFVPESGKWLLDDETLEECGVFGLATPVLFRRQYVPILVKIPEAIRNGIGVFKETSRHVIYHKKIMVSKEALLGKVIELLDIDNPMKNELESALKSYSIDSENQSLEFGLYTANGESLNKGKSLWSIVTGGGGSSSAIAADHLKYKLSPVPITIECSHAPNVKLKVSVDPLAPIFSLLPIFIRRFGLDSSFIIKELRELPNKQKINFNLCLIGNCLGKNCHLEIVTEGTIPENDPQNLWIETAKSNNITYLAEDPGVIATASLNQLITQLSSIDEKSSSAQYLNFMKTFILTYRSFTTPEMLLSKLIERYFVPRNMGFVDKDIIFSQFEKQRQKIQLRLCNVLQQWTKKNSYDFFERVGTTDKFHRRPVLEKLISFVDNIILIDHPGLGLQIRRNIVKMLNNYSQQTLTASRISEVSGRFKYSAEYLKLLSTTKNKNQSLFSFNSREIAEQLTLIEFSIFGQIAPFEFLNSAWTKHPDNAPNILDITKRFNQIALWVSKSLLEVTELKQRAKRMIKLIDIALNLYDLNNYATLMAFVAGFNKASVSRLKHTLEEIGAKAARKLYQLEQLMSAESSYKNYRQKLHSINPPCIPYLGVYLLDLTYIEDGNPNNIDGFVNFSKRRLVYDLIREVQQYQDIGYEKLQTKPELVALFQVSLHRTVAGIQSIDEELNMGDDWSDKSIKKMEDHLYKLSLEREPRGADRSKIV